MKTSTYVFALILGVLVSGCSSQYQFVREHPRNNESLVSKREVNTSTSMPKTLAKAVAPSTPEAERTVKNTSTTSYKASNTKTPVTTTRYASQQNKHQSSKVKSVYKNVRHIVSNNSEQRISKGSNLYIGLVLLAIGLVVGLVFGYLGYIICVVGVVFIIFALIGGEI